MREPLSGEETVCVVCVRCVCGVCVCARAGAMEACPCKGVSAVCVCARGSCVRAEISRGPKEEKLV